MGLPFCSQAGALPETPPASVAIENTEKHGKASCWLVKKTS